MRIPPQLTVNDTMSWLDDPQAVGGRLYDSASYELVYELRGGAAVTLTTVTQGQGWKTTIDATKAAQLVPGACWWQAVVTRTGERVTVGRGELQILPDIAGLASPYDGRSTAEKALADAEAALAAFRSSQGKVKRYAIGNRTMEFATVDELIRVVQFWKTRVLNESAAASIAAGLGNPRNLYVRNR